MILLIGNVQNRKKTESGLVVARGREFGGGITCEC